MSNWTDPQEQDRGARKRPPVPSSDLPDLFVQLAEGERLKAEGIAQADLHAAERWRQAAFEAVVLVSGLLPEFTTEDVWAALEQAGRDPLETERNPSAMGAVMLRAARAGLITKTGTYATSTRPSRHVAEMRVWRKTTTEEYRANPT